MEAGLNQFIQNLTDNLDTIEAGSLNADSPLEQIGLDSLETLSLVSMIKFNYDKTLNGVEIKSCATVEDLYTKIRKAG